MVCWSFHLLYLFSESIEIGWEAVEMENGSRDVIRFVLKEKEQSDSLRVFEPATSQAPAGRCQYTSTAIKVWSCNVPFESLRFAKDIQRVTEAGFRELLDAFAIGEDYKCMNVLFPSFGTRQKKKLHPSTYFDHNICGRPQNMLAGLSIFEGRG